MRVSTASIYGPRPAGGGLQVLVTRYYPRGVKRTSFDEWIRSLAPSPGLLRGYKDGDVAWDAFAERYVEQVREDAEAMDAMRRLRGIAREEGVTLLCYEPSRTPCHRHLLRRLIEKPRLSPIGRLEADYADYHEGVPV